MSSYYLLDEETENGSIHGYVTNLKQQVQLKNYLEEQRRSGALPLIQEKYNKIGLLKNMYVEEEERGNGIGTELLQSFINNAALDGAEAIVLVADTGEDNEFNLVEWYEGFDFEIFYGEKDNFPVMVLELSNSLS